MLISRGRQELAGWVQKAAHLRDGLLSRIGIKATQAKLVRCCHKRCPGMHTQLFEQLLLTRCHNRLPAGCYFKQALKLTYWLTGTLCQQ